LRLFSVGGYGLALAALALVVFGVIECPPFIYFFYFYFHQDHPREPGLYQALFRNDNFVAIWNSPYFLIVL